MKCHGYEAAQDNPQTPINLKIHPTHSVSMIPLVDIPNHRQPQRIDQTDFVTFGFNVVVKTVKDGESNKIYLKLLLASTKIKMLQFPAVTRYAYEEEFSYGYSKGVQPIQQLYTYGMVFENNPYAVINMPQNNIFKNYNPKQKELCLAIGCLDPKYYAEKDMQRDLIMYQGVALGEQYKHIHFSME